MAKFKSVSVKPPAQPVNPDLRRQTETGNDTAKKVGGWIIQGSVIKSGGITLDSSKPYILLKDDNGVPIILIGEAGT